MGFCRLRYFGSEILFVCGLLLVLSEASSSDKRTVSYGNLTCSLNDNIKVVYFSALGPHDTLHYIYSTHGVPSVLLARTEVNASLHIDCDQLLNDTSNITTGQSIKFTPDPNTVMVLLFTQLIQYDDKDNTANLNHYTVNSTRISSYNMANMTWMNISINTADDSIQMTAVGNGELFSSNSTNGSLILKFQLFEDTGYDSELPHLGYTGNISHINVVLDHLSTFSKKSRFAIELGLVTSDNIGNNMNINRVKSLDDEHSPGSYISVDWLTESSGNTSGGFLSWKPVCYNGPTPSVTSSSRVMDYNLEKRNITSDSMFSSGLVYALYGCDDSPTHSVFTKVSFGGAKDENFYEAAKNVSWTLSLGLGVPLLEGFSLLIILIISIGLGIPFLLIIVGVIYLVIKRIINRHHGYTEISSSYSEIN